LIIRVCELEISRFSSLISEFLDDNEHELRFTAIGSAPNASTGPRGK